MFHKEAICFVIPAGYKASDSLSSLQIIDEVAKESGLNEEPAFFLIRELSWDHVSLSQFKMSQNPSDSGLVLSGIDRYVSATEIFSQTPDKKSRKVAQQRPDGELKQLNLKSIAWWWS